MAENEEQCLGSFVATVECKDIKIREIKKKICKWMEDECNVINVNIYETHVE